MKVAHILPPRVLEGMADVLDDYHLLLPGLVSDEFYRQFYKGVRHEHIILDNGAAEGRITSFPHLLAMAQVLDADEIVLPDVMRDMDATLDAVGRVFYQAFTHRGDHDFMLVCQGKTVSECVQTVERAMNSFPAIIDSFGIPRHILSYATSARMQIVHELRRLYPGKPIHLLGTHPAIWTELAYYGREFVDAGVRGLDTSMAWNATLMEVNLKTVRNNSYLVIERQPLGEFARASLDPTYKDLLRENMEAISSWLE
jgi:hypothetical protein